MSSKLSVHSKLTTLIPDDLCDSLGIPKAQKTIKATITIPHAEEIETLDHHTVIIVIDGSGSMGYDTSKAGAAVLKVLPLLDNVDTHLVLFGSAATSYSGKEVESALSRCSSNLGGTSFASVYYKLIEIMDKLPQESKVTIIGLSDGESTTSHEEPAAKLAFARMIERTKPHLSSRFLALRITTHLGYLSNLGWTTEKDVYGNPVPSMTLFCESNTLDRELSMLVASVMSTKTKGVVRSVLLNHTPVEFASHMTRDEVTGDLTVDLSMPANNDIPTPTVRFGKMQAPTVHVTVEIHASGGPPVTLSVSEPMSYGAKRGVIGIHPTIVPVRGDTLVFQDGHKASVTGTVGSMVMFTPDLPASAKVQVGDKIMLHPSPQTTLTDTVTLEPTTEQASPDETIRALLALGMTFATAIQNAVPRKDMDGTRKAVDKLDQVIKVIRDCKVPVRVKVNTLAEKIKLEAKYASLMDIMTVDFSVLERAQLMAREVLAMNPRNIPQNYLDGFRYLTDRSLADGAAKLKRLESRAAKNVEVQKEQLQAAQEASKVAANLILSHPSLANAHPDFVFPEFASLEAAASMYLTAKPTVPLAVVVTCSVERRATDKTVDAHETTPLVLSKGEQATYALLWDLEKEEKTKLGHACTFEAPPQGFFAGWEVVMDAPASETVKAVFGGFKRSEDINGGKYTDGIPIAIDKVLWMHGKVYLTVNPWIAKLITGSPLAWKPDFRFMYPHILGVMVTQGAHPRAIVHVLTTLGLYFGCGGAFDPSNAASVKSIVKSFVTQHRFLATSEVPARSFLQVLSMALWYDQALEDTSSHQLWSTMIIEGVRRAFDGIIHDGCKVDGGVGNLDKTITALAMGLHHDVLVPVTLLDAPATFEGLKAAADAIPMMDFVPASARIAAETTQASSYREAAIKVIKAAVLAHNGEPAAISEDVSWLGASTASPDEFVMVAPPEYKEPVVMVPLNEVILNILFRSRQEHKTVGAAFKFMVLAENLACARGKTAVDDTDRFAFVRDPQTTAITSSALRAVQIALEFEPSQNLTDPVLWKLFFDRINPFQMGMALRMHNNTHVATCNFPLGDCKASMEVFSKTVIDDLTGASAKKAAAANFVASVLKASPVEAAAMLMGRDRYTHLDLRHALFGPKQDVHPHHMVLWTAGRLPLEFLFPGAPKGVYAVDLMKGMDLNMSYSSLEVGVESSSTVEGIRRIFFGKGGDALRNLIYALATMDVVKPNRRAGSAATQRKNKIRVVRSLLRTWDPKVLEGLLMATIPEFEFERKKVTDDLIAKVQHPEGYLAQWIHESRAAKPDLFCLSYLQRHFGSDPDVQAYVARNKHVAVMRRGHARRLEGMGMPFTIAENGALVWN